MNKMVKPLSETQATVTLSRASWNKILDRLDDRKDHDSLQEFHAKKKTAIADALPVALYRRMQKGEHPIRIWREHRGLGLNELSRASGVNAPYLSEIENGLKPGSAAALKKLATALAVEMDDLMRP